MANEPILIDKHYGGMTNDPNIGQVGSFYDGYGLEIRKDSKKIYLSPNYNQEQLLNTRTNGQIIGDIIVSNSFNISASRDGFLSNINLPESVYGRKYSSTSSFYDIFRYTGVGDYGVIIANNAIYRWAIDISTAYLGILGSNIVVNGDFNASSSWNIGSAWAIAGGKATHTPGGFNAVLDQTLTTINAKMYVINVDSVVRGGTCDVKMGGVTLGTLSTSTNGVIQSYGRVASGVSETISFNPTTDFDGDILDIKIEESNITSVVTKNFNEQCPHLGIGTSLLIGNGNVVTSIDVTTSSWSATDKLTIDRGFIIKGITKIGDQIFIYASDGSMTKQFLWDGVTADYPSRSITWYDKPLSRVISWNNIDYLVIQTDRKSSLWMVSGYQPQLIAQSNFINNKVGDKFAFDCQYMNSIETIGSKFLIAGTGCIYTYGEYSPGLPKSIIREYIYASGPTSSGTITNMYYSEDINGISLYYNYKKLSNTGTTQNYGAIQFLVDNKPNNTNTLYDKMGYIVESPIYSVYSQEKQTIKFRFGYKLEQNQLINIYAKIDNGGNTITFLAKGLTTLPTVGAIYNSGGNTYTVTKITNIGNILADKPCIIDCTYSGTNSLLYSGYLSKTSGIGDSTIEIYNALVGFEYMGTINDYTKYDKLFTYQKSFHKIQIAGILYTENAYISPEIYDYSPIFKNTNNQLT